MRRHPAVLATLALVCSVAFCPTAACADGPHQHGVASLQLVVEGNRLDITLDSPLDNLLGFEHGPRSAAELAAVRVMAQRLRGAAALVRPTPAAGCLLRTVALASPVIAPDVLAEQAMRGTPSALPAAGGHADLQARFSFVCVQPQALRAVALGGLFLAFTRLRQLDVALVTPDLQRGATLRPQQPVLAW